MKNSTLPQTAATGSAPAGSAPITASAASRRSFLKLLGTAAFAAPFIMRDLRANPPSNRVRLVAFGVGGMGGADLGTHAGVPGVEVVGLCDVDLNRAAGGRKRWPKAFFYQDYRELLDKEAKNFDAVTVGTPDHMHAPISISAMQLDKHVYCQKPLTHNLYETRRMTEIAREKKLVTQMGIQIHGEASYRTAVKALRDGVIGKIKEVWSFDGRNWGDAGKLPERTDEVPQNLNWDAWLGVAAARPFIGNGYYHPGNWRRRLDFGVGTLGDMACHIFDPVFGALDLGSPTSVISDGPAPNSWNWATRANVTLEFNGTPFTAGDKILVHWTDGGVRPPKAVLDLTRSADGKHNVPGSGSVFIGTAGVMVLPHIAWPRIYGRDDAAELNRKLSTPKLGYTVPRINHHAQFINAIRGEGKTEVNFDYAGPLTEAVLFGSVAVRFPKTLLKWNVRDITFDLAEANKFVRRQYRAGWEVKGV